MTCDRGNGKLTKGSCVLIKDGEKYLCTLCDILYIHGLASRSSPIQRALFMLEARDHVRRCVQGWYYIGTSKTK